MRIYANYNESDQIIHKLYGFTPEEIEIVDGKLNSSGLKSILSKKGFYYGSQIF